MLPEARKIIDDGIRNIVETVLKKSPWDPSFGLTPDTGTSELEYAIEIFSAIAKSAVRLTSEQARLRNTIVPRINHLPPEVLSNIFKYSSPRTNDYYASLGTIRQTSSYWAEIVRNDPSFWTVLHCSDPLHVVRIALERSRRLPLEVFFLCTDIPTPDAEGTDEGTDAGLDNHSHFHHYNFKELLREHLPPRRIYLLHFQPHAYGWESLQDLVTTPAPMLSVLTIDHDGGSYYHKASINLSYVYLFGGEAPNLQVLELTCCDLPIEYPPLPSLRICAISGSKFSRDDLLLLIAAAPALQDLSITDCIANGVSSDLEEGPSIPTTLHTRIRDLRIQDNTLNDDGGDIGLVTALDYFTAPELETFNVTITHAEVANKPCIAEWISTYTSNPQHDVSTVTIWVHQSNLGGSYVISTEIGPNFRIGITQAPPGSMEEAPASEVIVEIVNAIHPSAYPSITAIVLSLSQHLIDDIIPTLAERFSATTKLAVHCDVPHSWQFLGQKHNGEWPFPKLTTLRIDGLWLTEGAEAPLVDMLRARKEIGGPRAIRVGRGEVCPVFWVTAQELGVTVVAGEDLLGEEVLGPAEETRI